MKTKLYVGVILFFRSATHVTLETCLCRAADPKAAATITRNHANKFIERNKINYSELQIAVQEKDEFAARSIIGLASRTKKLIRDRIEIKLDGEVFYI